MIEQRAATLFAEIGYRPTDWPCNCEKSFREYSEKNQLFVCLNSEGIALGFALIDVFENHAHLEELDVDPEHHRKGAAKALLLHLINWAREKNFLNLTLRTFKTTPWSLGLYHKFDFHKIADDTFPYLDQLVKDEIHTALPLDDRISMNRMIEL